MRKPGGILGCASRFRFPLALALTLPLSLAAGVTATVDETTVTALVARAGPALRYLNLLSLPWRLLPDCTAWLVPALRNGGCFELEELRLHAFLTVEAAQELQQQFPRLRRGCYKASTDGDDCRETLSTLPGLDRFLMAKHHHMPSLAEALTAQAEPNVGALGDLITGLQISQLTTGTDGPIELDALATFLRGLPRLRELSCHVCQPFGAPGMATLSGLLSTTTLRNLTLMACDIDVTHAVAALGAPRLESLDLKLNRQLREDTGALGAAVGAHPTLRTLSLDYCDLSAATVASLGDALDTTNTLTELTLCDTPSFRRGAERFFAGLERNSSLRDLTLDRCAMGAACTRAAMRAVSRQGHLQRLSLASNELLDDGAAAVAAMLARKTCSLQHLDLESNGILGPGGIALSEAIGRNTSLTTLKLSENSCGVPPAAKALAAGLVANKSLRHLELRWWSLSGGSLAALGRAVGAHPALEVLDLSFNDVGDAGARAMAAALEQIGGCAALRILKMSDCSVAAGGARAFAKALRANTALRVLDLGGNDELTLAAFHALRQAFRDNGKLRQLQLGPELPDLHRGNPEEWDFD